MPQNTLSYPIDELIVQNVVSTLKKCTLNAGYHFNLIVERENQRGNSPRQGLVVVMAGDPIPQPSPPLLHDEFRIPIGMQGFVMESEVSGRDIETQLRFMAADIRRALRADLHRGALAVNTHFEAADQFFLEASPKHVLVTVMPQYRTLYNDPYNQ